MTRDPVAVQADGPLSTALRLMQEGGYRHLPVVDPADQPVGVLSVKRIVQYLAEHFPGTIFCQPPDPAAFPHQREGA
jgi:predicted transcriptional regulator